ncbi:hypothetical protein N2152v2_006123 [Parachlorella kessleri]
MTTLISFDVDGTLIHSVGEHANRLHKEAFTAAFKQVFNFNTSIDVIQHHGSTDPLILIKVLTDAHGIDKDQAMAKLPEMQQAMVDYYVAQRDRAGQGLELLPGVKELLLALKERGDVAVCLVTGNMEPIGWTKMEALGIKHLFTEPFFGGFGSDFCSGNTEQSWKDRAELVRIAAKRAEENLSGGLRARFHVGDAPMDVSAAEAAGAQAVGVTTGIYTRQELAQAGQSVVVLDGLQDLQSIFEVFNLS